MGDVAGFAGVYTYHNPVKSRTELLAVLSVLDVFLSSEKTHSGCVRLEQGFLCDPHKLM